jgi:hypothetical protein
VSISIRTAAAFLKVMYRREVLMMVKVRSVLFYIKYCLLLAMQRASLVVLVIILLYNCFSRVPDTGKMTGILVDKDCKDVIQM